jgi:hypothetical protein
MKPVKKKKSKCKIYSCEAYIQFIEPGTQKRVWKWVVRSASIVTKKDKIRCQFCGAPVSLFQGGKVTAQVEHMPDSPSVETCIAGSKFRKTKPLESGA